MTVATPIPRHSLHDMLVGGIREMIVSGELRPGGKVPEAQLCERFDVSRTPLREALKVLAAEGMIQLLPRRGAVVAQVTPEEIEELFPIMAVLEGLAGEMLCRHADAARIAALRAVHDRMMGEYARGDEPAYLRSNREFHDLLFVAAGNATLHAFYQQILTRIRAFRFIARKSPDNWRQAAEEHERIMEAIEARDGAKLSRLLRRHVNGVTVKIAQDALRQAVDGTAAR
ncbi:GntR family transcriptional regulator [Roseomonas sp. OT10]|uniref:GntR family transcriptional regulator n=1 Tax=Roseomonas cutis TaxID=2897332 RepID=UPI001E3CEB55|nr:GntR family transcriptional regulator [Roseomonas sp. OT10]UFN50561.1 GntR family transcriptional regulator [Roseomonas sp. OT10]